jgi:rare lipoprotein A
MIKFVLIVGLTLLFTACSTRGVPGRAAHESPPVATRTVPESSTYKHPTMRPYTVNGHRYYPTVVQKGDAFDGRASWYGPDFHGKLTSNGEQYNMYAATAAHKTLPMNTIVRVTNKRNGRQTVVRINDRGPFVASRVIDLSKKAATDLDMIASGTTDVHLEILGFAGRGERSIPSEAALRSGPSQQIVTAFYIQIGAFRRFEGAVITQEKYEGYSGYQTIIKDSEYNNERIFRVWLGKFKSEAEARDFIATSPFEQAFIVRK